MTVFDINKTVDTLLIVSQKNRRYFTKFDSTFGYLILTKDRKIFLTDYRYFEMAQEIKNDFELKAVSGGELPKLLKEILAEVKAKNVGFEDTELTVAEFNTLKDMLPDVNFISIGKDLAEVKKYKNAYETKCISKAQAMTDKAFSSVLSVIKEGMSEKELSVKLQNLLLELGGEKNAFDPIVSFGENTSKPHAHPTERKLQHGDNILMDFGCTYNGYCSDMTRTVFYGNPSEKMLNVYNVVLEAQLNALKSIKCGMTAKQADAFAREIFKKHNVEEYFTHGLGHGVGIDIHEIPSLNKFDNTILEQGMFVTVEPGLYFTGLGGVRIEDLILIQQDDIKNLTTSNKNIIIIQ